MEAMLKPSLIFDLILLAVLLASAMASYRKGLLTAIVQSGEVPGQVEVKASAKGLRPATLTLQVK